VLVTGGNGLVGSELISLLLKKGFEVYNLSRSGNAPIGAKGFKWDYRKGELDTRALEDVDVIFHLAGAGIAESKWTKSRQQEILDSRILTAKLLFDKVGSMKNKPKHFISASGVAFYGVNDFSTVFTEEAEEGEGFLASVTREWEKAAARFNELGILNSSIRTSIVLSSKGGAFKKLIDPVIWGIGSPLASGRQRMPWIHLDDLVNLFLFVYENQLEGAYNAVADENLTNREFTKQLCMATNRPMFMPNVPGFVLKILLGKMADEIAINGSAVSNKKIKEAGFNFNYNTLEEGLNDLLKK
tara:strand:- start:2046 stop:2945 length:900 start_codon:yes stop_codon:yes gene_type:complete